MLLERLDGGSLKRLKISFDGEDASGDYINDGSNEHRLRWTESQSCAKALVDNGLIDAMLITGDERTRMKKYLSGLLKGQFRPPDLQPRRVKRIRMMWE